MFVKRLLSIGWKTTLVLIVGLIIVYRIHFAPIPVESCAVKTGKISAEAMGNGTLEARVRATISPKISGRIAQVLVDQGDKVIKGQKLVLLDDEDLRQQGEIAKGSCPGRIKSGANCKNRGRKTCHQSRSFSTIYSGTISIYRGLYAFRWI